MAADAQRPREKAQDFIVALGRPLLAHRLRRLSERMVESAGSVLPSLGITAPPRSNSTLLLLREHGSLAVTEIAAGVRLSHPLIIKLVDELLAKGLVRSEIDAADRRRRVVSLTAKGKREADRFTEMNRTMAALFADLEKESGHDLFAALEAFEAALDVEPLSDRMRKRVKAAR